MNEIEKWQQAMLSDDPPKMEVRETVNPKELEIERMLLILGIPPSRLYEYRESLENVLGPDKVKSYLEMKLKVESQKDGFPV